MAFLWIAAVILLMGCCVVCALVWHRGPLIWLYGRRLASLPGNAAQYSPEAVTRVEGSALAGKHIIFLGSSVTYGAAAMGVSFADYVCARTGATMTKEAVSGTTLADDRPDSYVARLKRLDGSIPADLFVCQLSTNDASQQKPLGAVSPDGDYDTATVAGAIEFIISYAKDTWNCPVVFYTNPRYGNESYAAMVRLLGEIARKRGVAVADLWNDVEFNDISAGQRALYMADAIHPTRAGYLEWWTPYLETVFEEVISK